MDNVLNYKSPGPITSRFLGDWDATVIGLNGPVGSAKTTSVFMKAMMAMQHQPPSIRDGIGRMRVLVVRDTYPNMANATLPSWHNLVPETIGRKVATFPAEHNFTFTVKNRYGIYEMRAEMLFRAVGDVSSEQALRGLEPTFAICNELDLLPDDILSYLLGRCGRYPQVSVHGESFFTGVLADFNAPHENNWVYERFYLNRPDAFKLYRLPGGMEAGAENLENLPGGRDYYTRQLGGMGEDEARRMVHNEPGFSKQGKPCWPEFSSTMHTKNTIEVLADAPLYIGLDQGNNPGAVIGQADGFGQLRLLGEVHGENMLPTAFADAMNYLLNGRFRGLPIAACTADPAAFARNNDTTWARVISDKTGLKITPAHTNDIPVRLDCVRTLLTKLGHNTRPMFVLDTRHCPGLYHAMAGAYRYRRLSNKEVMDRPDKNAASNIADALQYLVMGFTGAEYLSRGRDRAGKRRRVVMSRMTMMR